ncbi:segregation and condensation protein B [Tamaricihabitans halophyticus]|uniref:Segregation and condensation protein B n=1 Tax=Tamaricihabitans halophyticus TaxID=1262583 RepID=A0A4R2PTG8_9PSEU|nr:SMC-Scp complex subunit ScpB [Tamaricihabitans halophyticus]TCP39210.1 segregation and condensation protein B [Tamaricihabitans halophyticus]
MTEQSNGDRPDSDPPDSDPEAPTDLDTADLDTAVADAVETETVVVDDPAEHVGRDDTAAVDATQAQDEAGEAEVDADGEQVGPADDVARSDEPEQSGEPGDDEAAIDTDVPVLSSDTELDAALEAILLVVDAPAEEESLAEAVVQPVERVVEALHRLAGQYDEAGRGIDLRKVGEGWRFYTRDKFAPYVEKLLMDGQRSKLTRAALETLAVIAYRQPVTRTRVAAVRGVNVDGVVRTLLARGLIEEAGADTETGGTRYTTTELFLERLGLSSLEDLPPIAPLLPEVDSIDDI